MAGLHLFVAAGAAIGCMLGKIITVRREL